MHKSAMRWAWESARLIWIGVLLVIGAPWAGAQSSLVSATPATPITLGQALNITVVVKNTSLFTWTAGNLGASWRIRLDNPSWSAGWSRLQMDSPDDVKKNATASMVMTVSAANLPQVGGTYTVRVNTYYNNMGLSLDAMGGSPQTVSFTINAGNQAPMLAALSNRVVVETNLVSFSATATDADAGQTLTFSLDPGAPSGASMTTNGIFTWTPPVVGAAPQTNQITVRVTDSGTPPLSDSKSCSVVVIQPPRFDAVAPPLGGVMALSWGSFPGVTYQVRSRESVGGGPWLNVTNGLVASGLRTWVTNQVTGPGPRFYQLLLVR